VQRRELSHSRSPFAVCRETTAAAPVSLPTEHLLASSVFERALELHRSGRLKIGNKLFDFVQTSAWLALSRLGIALFLWYDSAATVASDLLVCDLLSCAL